MEESKDKSKFTAKLICLDKKCKKHYKDKAFVCCRRKSIFIFAVPFLPPPLPLTPTPLPPPQNK